MSLNYSPVLWNKQKKTYDLNLSDKYVRNWGIWEVGREIISNAIDADSKNYEVEVVSSDCIRVFTATCPEFGHIKVIGSGTKTDAGLSVDGNSHSEEHADICNANRSDRRFNKQRQV